MTETDTLMSHYDGIVCDLDGVVYRGPEAVDHAVSSLEAARTAGVRIAYATNNASRPPERVCDHLRKLGLRIEVSAVVTSSQAGARHLADRLETGASVLAVGGEGVALALEEAGLTPVRAADVSASTGQIGAVLQGLGADVTWADLAQAAYCIQSGAIWVATNADTTVPTDKGTAPGNGALVGAVRHAVGIDPIVVGKPRPPLYELSASVLGTDVGRTLAIGDRLDTDLEGAVATGMDGLFVLTGVSRVRDVALADPQQRPTHLCVDLRALGERYIAAEVGHEGDSRSAACGDSRVRLEGHRFTVESEGAGSELLRCVIALAWAVADSADRAVLDDVAPDEWDDLERRILTAAAQDGDDA